MKSVAELKRAAKTGLFSAELIEWFGNSEIPERLRGRRKIVDSNTKGIKLMNLDGSISELRIEAASLVEFDGDLMKVYMPGLRDPNPEEQAVLDGWKAITESPEYKRELEDDLYSDGSATYYREKAYYEQHRMLYLMGFDRQRGKLLDWNSGKISDYRVRGDLKLCYRIYRD